MHVHTIGRFTPKEGKADEFREIFREAAAKSKAEANCVGLEIFETISEPKEFAIHSAWASMEAFEEHAEMPHTQHFIEIGEKLLTHPIKVMRLNRIEPK